MPPEFTLKEDNFTKITEVDPAGGKLGLSRTTTSM